MFKEEAAKREDTIQAQARKLQFVLQQEDIGIGTLISELKQEHTQWNSEPENLFENKQYRFGEKREELVACLLSELSFEGSITSDFLKTEQTKKLDALLTNYTSSESESDSSDLSFNRLALSSKHGKASLEAKAIVPTLERTEAYFGSVSDLWNHGKEFGFVNCVVFVILILSVLLLRTTNISFARMVGLDVDSIITQNTKQQAPIWFQEE